MRHPVDCFLPVGNAPQLGLAISCAKGVVLPADFMTSGQTNPLPKATPGTAPAKTSGASVLPWVIGAAAVGGLAWWAWSSGALAANPKEIFVAFVKRSLKEKREEDIEAPTIEGAQHRADQKWPGEREVWIVGEYTSDGTHWGKGRGRSVAVRERGRWTRFSAAAANPAVTRAASQVWERAYREALREGLKRGEAEQYASEVLRAYRDDEANRLGGALGQPEEAYANPHGRSILDILGRAGWSFELADRTLRSSGVARTHNGLLYVLTDDSGDTIPSDPREPMVVGVYALDERAGEWVDVGQKDFTNLRNALQRWNTVWVDMDEVNRIAEENTVTDEDRSYGPHHRRRANPGRAKKLGVRPSDVDPKELARGTKHELEHTDSRKVAARIALEHLAEDEHYYEHLDAMERSTFRSNPRYRTKAAFSRKGKWGWVTWTHQEPNKHAAIIAKGHELGAEGWDFGNADHYSVSDYPGGRGFGA